MTSHCFSKHLLIAVLLIHGLSTNGQSKFHWVKDTAGSFSYSYVTNDPAKTRFYTLSNGLTVILSQNKAQPHITFRMAVRAGSNTDPRNNTGLAHYLEHLLFKGTDRFGTINYEKEKPLLKQIEQLFERYDHCSDTTLRKRIYHKIDSISFAASSYSIANGYDKIMKAIGSSTTNAYTSREKTVYIEDLPANAIDQFLQVQSERFRSPVFRNFHTELEVVYEEKNRWLDDDRNQMYQKTLQALFPTHNYGQQTTIGTIEDLKNPSLVEIKKYYNKYYVPNNMAIVMVGDFDYDSLIRKINRNFAYMTPKPVHPYSVAPEAPLTRAQTIDIYGPGKQNLFVSYRGYAQHTKESLLLRLISKILSNGHAGLIDVHIKQKQTMLGAGASYDQLKDYGIFSLTGSPKEGQSLEQAKKILLEQISLLKQGKFDQQLITAIMNNMQLSELRAFDNNDERADKLVEAFTFSKGKNWDKNLSATARMSHITKDQIVRFANDFFKQNYVAVLKHKGDKPKIAKVRKPNITPIKMNAQATTAFAQKIMAAPVKPIIPKFLNYKKDIHFSKSGGLQVLTVKNKENAIFKMTYHFNFGSLNNKQLPYAAQYLSYLGTSKYTLEELNKLFYNMACSYTLSVRRTETVISISGLQKNFEKAVKLLEHVLSDCKSRQDAFSALKNRIHSRRENAKQNKGLIMSGLTAYARYGPDNPFNYGLTGAELKHLRSTDLIDIIHNLCKHKHSITYYGPLSPAEFSAAIVKLHKLPQHFLRPAKRKHFTYTKINKPTVYFANYPMVQTEIYWARNTKNYDPKNAATINTFNQYFGEGMGSIVSQSLRESKALAYSTFAVAWVPDTQAKQTAILAYVGTQADKMKEATLSMDSLLTKMPLSKKAFALARASKISQLATSRITKHGVIRAYFADKKLGLKEDSRKLQFKALQHLKLQDIIKYYNQNVSGKPFSYCALGANKNVNYNSLQYLGEVTKLSLKQIFGY